MDGEFNVPMGSGAGQYFSKDDLLNCSKLLQTTVLVAGDFTKTLGRVTKGDFVYLDPPYAVNSRRVFKEYGKEIFDISDMPRFMAGLNMIDAKGADFLVSYADCAESRLLASRWHSIRLPIRRHVAGFTGNRRIAYEWLISNRPVTALRRDVKHGAP